MIRYPRKNKIILLKKIAIVVRKDHNADAIEYKGGGGMGWETLDGGTRKGGRENLWNVNKISKPENKEEIKKIVEL